LSDADQQFYFEQTGEKNLAEILTFLGIVNMGYFGTYPTLLMQLTLIIILTISLAELAKLILLLYQRNALNKQLSWE
jgi:hypothetical protein